VMVRIVNAEERAHLQHCNLNEWIRIVDITDGHFRSRSLPRSLYMASDRVILSTAR
jgi:hypothetical protein